MYGKKKPPGPQHVLAVEAKALPQAARIHLFGEAEKVRLAKNELTGIMAGRLKQLKNTKKYGRLLGLYAKSKSGSSERAAIVKSLEDEQKKYGLTWDNCRKAMQPIGKKYKLHSVFALTTAEDVFAGVKDVLFRDGKRLHFAKRGSLPVMRAKQPNRAVVVRPYRKGRSYIEIRVAGLSFTLRPKDRFEKDELEQILQSLQGDPKGFAVCYASIVCRKIRGKLRVFVHFTLDGLPVPKYDRHGRRRHPRNGVGIVAADIGTQSLAYVSGSEIGLKNLADRWGEQDRFDARIEELLQKMDRSRRAMNPQNYNEDGTICKGRKKWKKSKHYLKLQEEYANLCRARAVSRKCSVREDANHMRELGDVFVTEPKNAKKLAKRASKTTYRPDGRPNRKKRFGRSIQNRSPGAFQEAMKQCFERTAGRYIEVPAMYRASQYDHSTRTYVKKKLGTRMYRLGSGETVQRDLYAAYLMFCLDEKAGTIDQNKADAEFAGFLSRQHACIARIRSERLDIKNSGITF